MVATAIVPPLADNIAGGATVTGAASMSIALANPSTADYIDVSSGDTPSVVTAAWQRPLPNVQARKAYLHMNVQTTVGVANQPPLAVAFTRAGVAVAQPISMLSGSSPGPFSLRPEIEIDTSVWYQQDEQVGVGFEPILIAITNPGACTYRIYSMWLEFDVVTFADIGFKSPQGLTYLNTPAIRFTYEQEDESPLTSARLVIFTSDQYGRPGFNPTDDTATALTPEYDYADIAVPGGNAPNSGGQALPSSYYEEQAISIVRRPTGATATATRGNLLPGKYRAYVSLGYSGEYFPTRDYAEFEVAEYVPPVSQESSLGCGEYVVEIQQRGGGTRVGRLPWSGISYSRVVDEFGTGTITIPKNEVDEQCAWLLARINPWEHEIAIYRNNILAFVGPLVDYSETLDTVTVYGRDLFTWFDRRVLPYDRVLRNTDLSAIFQVFAEDALERDPSPNIDLVIVGSGISGSREVRAAERRYAGDQMRELARSGLDFTVIGRTLLVGSVELPLARLPLISDAYATPTDVAIRGLDMASEDIVVGAGGGPNSTPATGVATGDIARLGLVQRVEQENTILDDATALASAEGRLALVSNSYANIPVTFSPTAPIPLEQLVPGAVAPLSFYSMIRSVEGEYRLRSLSVNAQASESGVVETVSGVFTPVGLTQ